MSYRQFIFESYSFDVESGQLELHYSLDGVLQFTENYRFDFPFATYNAKQLEAALQLLFLVAGVSYFKTYTPPEILTHDIELDQFTADFLGKTYQKGLGEFWYINSLDPATPVIFPAIRGKTSEASPGQGAGLLVGVGGGKDSLTSIELLRNHRADITTWSLNHRPQLSPLVERIGLPHLWVERKWDPKLAELASQGALNGHVPISAIFACVGTVVAILAGKQDVITSNERSANEPTLVYRGSAINHQYSKSLEFEQDFQAVLRNQFGESIRYYSFLRPLSELKIAEIFAGGLFEKYKDVFSSCNRAYTEASDQMFWCGICPKCAFTFLVFTPFIARDKLETLFGGKSLILDPALAQTYKQLLGIEGDKPLECVGEIAESRAAMSIAQQNYPELLSYSFDLPADYDYRSLGPHSMPDELYKLLLDGIG